MRKPVLPISVLLTAVTLLLAACGGVDKNAYIRTVSDVQADQQNLANKEAKVMAKSEEVSVFSNGLRAIAKEASDNAKRLQSIEVPSDVTDEHKRYVSLYETYAKDLNTVAADMDRDLGAGQTITAKELTAFQDRVVAIDSTKATNEQKIVNDINTKLQS